MGHKSFHRYGSPQHRLLLHFPVEDERSAPSGKLQQAQDDKDTDDNACNSCCNTDFMPF